MHFISLLLFIVGFSHSHAGVLEWCDYWSQRGVFRSECSTASQPHWSVLRRSSWMSSTPKPNWAVRISQCRVVTNVGHCVPSGFCSSSLLCWVGGEPCCGTPYLKQISVNTLSSTSTTCPAPHVLSPICIARNTVNWCNTDGDCQLRNSMQRCCPTSCGYNICTSTAPPIVDLAARISSVSSVPAECPRIDTLPTTCTRHGGVSWCQHHSHCRQSTMHTRYCCPTRCGYNVCVLKTGNQFIIA